MTLRIFRVTVRGRFERLDEDVAARLLVDAPGHDVAQAGFTEGGTLTYEPTLRSFNFRFRLRDDSELEPDAHAAVVAAAEARAVVWLEGLGATWSSLRIDAHDMADVWEDRA